MKKLFSLCLICLMAVSAMAQDQNVNVVVIGGGSSSNSGAYVDLGLPSGTLWKRQNESGYYTCEEALDRFGSKLPERHHFVELINECTWIWIEDYGYKVVGPNGNSITLPAAGCRTCEPYLNMCNVGTRGEYWSSTPYDSYFICYLNFYSRGVVYVDYHDCCGGRSVRLVQ